jgi:hypothetical protein
MPHFPEIFHHAKRQLQSIAHAVVARSGLILTGSRGDSRNL